MPRFPRVAIRARPRPMSTRRAVLSATLPFTQSIAGCLASSIGEHGLSDAELASWLGKLAAPLAELKDSYRQRTLPLLRLAEETADLERTETDRKSTRLNSSHLGISYAVFCLKKKT